MMITKGTKLADLLQEYPWLKSEVMQISDKFKTLNTPVGKIMLKKATVAEMSKKSGIAEDQIIQKLTELIEKHK